MKKVMKSVVLPNCFPLTRRSLNEMEKTLGFLGERGISQVELFCDGIDLKILRNCLEKEKIQNYFVAIVPLKEKKLSLCAIDDMNRTLAVSLTRKCIEMAYELGSKRVMINSGEKPQNKKDTLRSLAAFERSLEELWDYVMYIDHKADMELSLEPCDSQIQAKNLIGSTKLSVDVCRNAKKKGIPLWLAMDTAHIAEEGENILTSLQASREFCDHVHFANCVLSNTRHPMYGDKHVTFDYNGAMFSKEKFADLYREFGSIYEDRELCLAIEYFCRDSDPFKEYDLQATFMPW